MKLSLYFRYTRSAASVVLLYDEDAFAAGTGERVTKSYLLTLQQMLTNRFETISAFRANLEERLRAEKKFQAAYQEEEKARLQNAVSLMPLLQGEDAGMIQVFMKQGTLFTYYEGDRIEGM